MSVKVMLTKSINIYTHEIHESLNVHKINDIDQSACVISVLCQIDWNTLNQICMPWKIYKLLFIYYAA